MVIHAGWQINKEDIPIEEFLKEDLPFNISELLNNCAYRGFIAEVFTRNNKDMTPSKWYDNHENINEIANIHAVYYHQTKKNTYLIVEAFIKNKNNYINIISTSDMIGLDLKRHASSGEFGDRVELKNKIKIPMNAYITYV